MYIILIGRVEINSVSSKTKIIIWNSYFFSKIIRNQTSNRFSVAPSVTHLRLDSTIQQRHATYTCSLLICFHYIDWHFGGCVRIFVFILFFIIIRRYSQLKKVLSKEFFNYQCKINGTDLLKSTNIHIGDR